MDKVERKAFPGTLLLFSFTLLISWKLRSRNFSYVMDLCGVLLLTAVLKVAPFLELSVNNLVAMASAMLLDKAILPLMK